MSRVEACPCAALEDILFFSWIHGRELSAHSWETREPEKQSPAERNAYSVCAGFNEWQWACFVFVCAHVRIAEEALEVVRRWRPTHTFKLFFSETKFSTIASANFFLFIVLPPPHFLKSVIISYSAYSSFTAYFPRYVFVMFCPHSLRTTDAERYKQDIQDVWPLSHCTLLSEPFFVILHTQCRIEEVHILPLGLQRTGARCKNSCVVVVWPITEMLSQQKD